MAAGGGAGHPPPGDPEGPRRQGQGARDAVERRGLARAVRADEPEDLALAHLERDGVERREAPEPLGEPADREHEVRSLGSRVPGVPPPCRRGSIGRAAAGGDTMPRTDAQTRTPAKRARSERLEARISRAQKDLFVRAADLQGRSLTDFVVVSAQEAALQTGRAPDALRLSERDREAFVSALLTPSAPAKTLPRAARRYRERTGLGLPKS